MTDQPRPCRIDGCTKTRCPGRTLCCMHRNRIRRFGNPGPPGPIRQPRPPRTRPIDLDDQDIHIITTAPRPTPGLNLRSRRLITRGLTDHGLPAHEIARILGVAPRTVFRYRKAARTGATQR